MEKKQVHELHSLLLLIGEDLMELGTDEVMKVPAYSQAMEKIDAAVLIVWRHLTSRRSRAAGADENNTICTVCGLPAYKCWCIFNPPPA